MHLQRTSLPRGDVKSPPCLSHSDGLIEAHRLHAFKAKPKPCAPAHCPPAGRRPGPRFESRLRHRVPEPRRDIPSPWPGLTSAPLAGCCRTSPPRPNCNSPRPQVPLPRTPRAPAPRPSGRPCWPLRCRPARASPARLRAPALSPSR